MSQDSVAFNSGAIRPMECWSAGWQLLKEQYWLMVGIGLVALIVGSVGPMGILMGPMMCGVFIALLTLMRRERIEFGLLFKGFDYFVPSLIATLVQMAPILVLMIPASMVFAVLFVMAGANAGPDADGAPVVAGLVIGGIVLFVLFVLLLSLALAVLLLFIHPLIVERKLSGWDACKVSVAAVRANLGGAVGLVLLNALFGFLGVLLCYFGVFLVLPVQWAAVAVAYRQVFPDLGAPLTSPARPVGRITS